MLDLLFHNAKSLHYLTNIDIGIENGTITYINETGASIPPVKQIIEAGGHVVLPGFNESHIHLEKAYLLEKMDTDAHSLQEAIQMTAALKKSFTKEDMTERATRVIEKSIQSGVTNLRAQVEVDDLLNLSAMETIMALKEKYKSKITIQIVVFPQEGIFIQKNGAALMEESLKMGADVVGGIPYNDRDQTEHLDFIFNLAEKYGKPMDIHIDDSDNPEDLSILDIIKRTKDNHFENNVTVAHMTSLGSVDHNQARDIAKQIADAGIHVVALPATDLYINGRQDKEKIRRGLTPVKTLLNEQANVIFATNNIQNPFTPFGTGNILDIAYLFAEVTQMGTSQDAETILDMMTYQSAKALGLEHYGIYEGGLADLVLLDANNLRNVLLDRPRVICSYKNGHKII
ncbi:amidohydrolase family protein [Sporolactobacillus kofuensis]|uniref:Amidohydrolase family protein n=1 Tax=Sporolactobacillus kofuensis TaxID=269672 RepID=A0ABW1WCZ5_9BACL|nr:amidohydrolase family protein [Sporolactobacillus kofuensis]MCO7175816.1 amidohydrolase family protein [Sporolactobacillus kofuensis]